MAKKPKFDTSFNFGALAKPTPAGRGKAPKKQKAGRTPSGRKTGSAFGS